MFMDQFIYGTRISRDWSSCGTRLNGLSSMPNLLDFKDELAGTVTRPKTETPMKQRTLFCVHV